uniref:aldo-keto reductase family 1 member B7-like isoform X1 n=2 Tax=Styela clava TaxID=7725 RepID=UPI00193A54D8|nr:aldo-keto reductase family 1 member B7-like isoform X1 [Styela clava]
MENQIFESHHPNMDMDFITLNTGYKMPAMALGTWKDEDLRSLIRTAIGIGYRHIDCAWFYRNENVIGDTLQDVYNEGKVKRENMYLTSKLWCQFNHPNDVREGFMQSLNNLQTDYLDAFLMHIPCAMPKTNDLTPVDEDGNYRHNNEIHYVDTWKEMEKLQKDGLVRSIGVSNFNKYQINRILKECSIKPAVHLTESHPYLTDRNMVKFCKDNGIAVMAFGVLGSKRRKKPTIHDPILRQDRVLKSIAEKREKNIAQIAIRFQIQRGIGAVINSSHESRLKSNFQVYDFELSDEEMELIYDLNKDWRAFDLKWFLEGHKYWPHKPNYSEDDSRQDE